jgi:hypothetical protein
MDDAVDYCHWCVDRGIRQADELVSFFHWADVVDLWREFLDAEARQFLTKPFPVNGAGTTPIATAEWFRYCRSRRSSA